MDMKSFSVRDLMNCRWQIVQTHLPNNKLSSCFSLSNTAATEARLAWKQLKFFKTIYPTNLN